MGESDGSPALERLRRVGIQTGHRSLVLGSHRAPCSPHRLNQQGGSAARADVKVSPVFVQHVDQRHTEAVHGRGRDLMAEQRAGSGPQLGLHGLAPSARSDPHRVADDSANARRCLAHDGGELAGRPRGRAAGTRRTTTGARRTTLRWILTLPATIGASAPNDETTSLTPAIRTSVGLLTLPTTISTSPRSNDLALLATPLVSISDGLRLGGRSGGSAVLRRGTRRGRGSGGGSGGNVVVGLLSLGEDDSDDHEDDEDDDNAGEPLHPAGSAVARARILSHGGPLAARDGNCLAKPSPWFTNRQGGARPSR